MKRTDMILAKDQYYNTNCYETHLNNNVLIVGTSGSGKTRSIISPNILQASGSYVISDPKGQLYKKYSRYLASQGYVVKKLDFLHPTESCHYNFFEYIRTEEDINGIAHMLIYGQRKQDSKSLDPFWEEAAELLLQAIIAFLVEERPKKEQNLESITKLLAACQVRESDADEQTALDRIMESVAHDSPSSYAVKQYKKFRIAAAKTLRSILITLNARIGRYDSKNLNEMLKYDEINIPEIGSRKTALFVIVSDKNREMDGLANVFFSQTMTELCNYADDYCTNQRLPVDVRFFLDDFATNVSICEFPRMISSIRSRGISVVLSIQAESQLEASYGVDGRTITANCDTYVYLGGNDLETVNSIALRCDLPLKKVLNMPVGRAWIFRRGQEPVNAELFQLESFELERMEVKER